MGANSPEWVMTFMGAICYNAVITGIYSTNEPDACLYQATHANAEVVVVDSIDRLKRFTVNMNKLPKVKALVVWGVNSLPDEFRGKPGFFLWKDFLMTGAHVDDEVINRRMHEQEPGQCCNLIYTSGTTGNPKGVMLSHDNLVWGSNSFLHNTSIISDRGPENRVVSYLPLSHIAGLQWDVINPLLNKHC